MDLEEFERGLQLSGASVSGSDAQDVFQAFSHEIAPSVPGASPTRVLPYDTFMAHLRNHDRDTRVSLPLDEDNSEREAQRRHKYGAGYHISLRSNPVFRPERARSRAPPSRAEGQSPDRSLLSAAEKKELLIREKVRGGVYGSTRLAAHTWLGGASLRC